MDSSTIVTTVPQGFLAGVLTSMAIQGLKKANIPWLSWLRIPEGSEDKVAERINRTVAIIAALFVAIGVTSVWNYDPATGLFNLAFSGSVTGIKSGLFEWGKQFALQQTAYKATIALPETLGRQNQLLADLHRMLTPPIPVERTDV